MKRDKIVSIRARTDLIEKANKIIEENTKTFDRWTYKRYYNHLPGKYSGSMKYFHKFSLSDLFEIALNEFIEECSNKDNIAGGQK